MNALASRPGSVDLFELIDALPTLVSYVDRDERYRFCNRAYERWFGVPREQQVGRTVREVVGDEARATLEGPISSALAGRESAFDTELVYHRGGTRHVHARYVPHRVNGEVAGFFVLVEDVTEGHRALAEAADRKREAEDARNLLDTLLEHVPEGITIVAGPPDFPVVANSRLAAEMLQRPPAALRGRPAGHHVEQFGLFMADGCTRPAPEQLPLYRAAQLGQRVRDEHWVIRRPDGTAITVLVDVNPIRDREGRIQGAINCWRDVTERERTEQRLRDSEERFRVAQESSPIAFSMFRPVHDGARIVDFETIYANPAAVRASGRDVVTGERLLTLYPQARNNGFFDLLAAALRTEAPQRRELRFVGEGFDHLFDVSAVRMDAEVAVWLQDLSDRERALARLRESEARFSVIADSSPILVWVHDASGKLLTVNRAYCEFFGVTEEEVRGPNWRPLVHPEDAAHYVDEFVRCTAERVPFRAQARVRRGDGAWRWIDSVGLPRFSAAGEFLGLTGSSPDITDRVEMEQALREADRRKDEFLATLAHELRNPLAPIRQAATIARSPAANATQVRWSLDVIERQVSHMALLLDDLLDVSRITRGRLALNPSPLDLRGVIDIAVETARPVLDASRQRIAIEMPAAPVTVHADPLRLAQVLANLLTNAGKYGEPDGVVNIAVRTEADAVCIEVRDTGIGIAADALAAVFEVFSDAKPALDRTGKGLGIGLALARALVALHGGTLTAVSAGVGCGATFTVRLPRSGAAVAPASAAAREARAAASGRRILVVDDNADAAESLAAMLRLAGHEVMTAHGGAAGLDAAGRFAPDAALLDLGMPDLDGYALARELRARRAEQPLTLIAVTGWGQAEDRRRSAAAGFDHHLTKPVDPDELAALLARATPGAAAAGDAPAPVKPG
jgi:PAS domain S-box-containing protein